MFSKYKRPTIITATLFILGITAFLLAHTVFADVQNGLERQLRKLVGVARLAQMYYVEDIEWDDAMEGAISGMLEKLDPHSVYIPAEKVSANKENFSGKYEGIGIQYDIIDGYITVISPIPGSPSERLGIMSGDRIIKIDGKSAVGIERDEVPKKLKGPKGTSVKVAIQREGAKALLEFTIIRDVIPISTITASFMADDSTGYIAVNRFAAITSKEVEEKLQALEKNGLKRLILDLRGNSGGYLHEAVKLAGKFIKGHKLIVYTRGRSERIDDEYYADQFGRRLVRNYPLILLINRGSASAAEIVAGAIQDYDRGLIVGENSFGKGLVQKEFPLQDGSAVRITTAKYYTPSGRCIQRDYKGKNVKGYYDDIPDSTWITEDSLSHRPQYYTEKGRTVYGGGGIQPDFYVAYHNASKSPELINSMLTNRAFFEYVTEYVRRRRINYKDVDAFSRRFTVDDTMMADFRRVCAERKVDLKEEEFTRDQEYIRLRIKAEIARHLWGQNAYYFVMLEGDNQFRKALTLFGEARKLAALH